MILRFSPPTFRLEQRAQVLQYISLGIAGLMVTSVAVSALIEGMGQLVAWYALAAVLSVVGWWLARRQQVLPGSLIVFLSFIGVNLALFLNADNRDYAIYVVLPFMLLLLPATALLLGTRAILVATACGLATSLLLIIAPLGLSTPMITLFVQECAILCTGGLTWLSTRQLENALGESHGRAEALAKSERQLQQQAAHLRERTGEAEARQREATQALQELRTTIHERDDLARSLQEATLPVMPVHEQIIVLPLIGGVDSNRAAMLTATLLAGIERHHARAVIIDVTGVPLVDTQVAGALIQAAHAARLLGAQTVLVGIRPEVAQTIVGLGVNLAGLIVRADLQSGIRAALQQVAVSRN